LSHPVQDLLTFGVRVVNEIVKPRYPKDAQSLRT
jgi:hypothetical protein